MVGSDLSSMNVGAQVSVDNVDESRWVEWWAVMAMG
jgi:hypothetical protein